MGKELKKEKEGLCGSSGLSVSLNFTKNQDPRFIFFPFLDEWGWRAWSFLLCFGAGLFTIAPQQRERKRRKRQLSIPCEYDASFGPRATTVHACMHGMA